MFGFSHKLNSRSDITDAFAAQFLEGDFGNKTIERNPAVVARKTVGGQGMVGAAGIIAGTFATVITQENRTSPGYSRYLAAGSFHGKGKVFRGTQIAEFNTIGYRAEQDGLAVLQRLSGNGGTWQGRKLLLKGR